MLAWSMTIGGISVQSYLNEPFRAEVTLNNLQKGDLQNLDAKLADEETFGRFGLERSKFLLSLQFKLLADSDPSTARVIVSSPQIAREPFFSILIQLQAQRERLVREFTILLDPRGAAPSDLASAPAAPAAPVVEMEPMPAPVEPVPQPDAYANVQPRAKAPATDVVYSSEPVVSRGQYGPIRPGETLWGVAAAVRPSERVTMNQVMWALYSHNESSFAGTIGALQKGSVLKVPSEQAMLDVSPAEARALIASASKASAGAPAKPIEKQTVAVEKAPVATAAPVVTSAPARDDKPYYAEPEEAEAAISEEQAVPEPEEPALELVEPADGDVEAYEQLEALPQDEGMDTSATDDAAEGDMSAQEAAELDALDVLEEEAESAGVESEMAPTESASTGDSNLMLLVGGGIALLVLIGAFLGLRRKGSGQSKPPVAPVVAAAATTAAARAAETTADLGDDFDSTQEVEDESADQASAAMAASDELDTIEEMPDLDATAQFDMPPGDMGMAEDVGLEDAGLDFDDVPSPAPSNESSELGSLDLPDGMDEIDEAEGTLDLGSETVSLELNEDPLSEADFQLAYGLYDEAAMLLQRAIESDPQRVELHEKLAETHFAANNPDGFKDAATKLKQLQPPEDVWQRITIMGQQLSPGDALYEDDGDGLSGTDGAIDLDMGFDDDDSNELASLDFDEGTPAPNTADEDNNVLEFTLDDPESGDTQGAAAHKESTIFEANFDDLGADLGTDTASDDLPDLDDLGLDDLEAELEGDSPAAAPSDDLAELSLDEPVTDSSADDIGLETDFDLDDLASETAQADEPTLDAGELSLDDSTPNLDAPLEFTLEPAAEPAAEASELELGEELSLSERSETRESTDFELGDITDLGLDDGSSDSELTLTEEPAVESAGAFEIGDVGEEDELTLETPESGFELGDLESEGTDFDLDDISAEATDFELDDADGESTDFDLGDIGSDTDFDLGEATDFELDEPSLDGASEDFDLGSADTADIAGGDEAGTKLDLATAYVEMGEADMARNLLEDVMSSGSDEQKAQAQELLDRL